jgi:glycosyltransferase involved in cell wall biosynthesis
MFQKIWQSFLCNQRDNLPPYPTAIASPQQPTPRSTSDRTHFLPKSSTLSIVTQFYPPDYAATGQFIQELAAQLGKQGMNVRIFTGQPGYAFETPLAPPIESSENLHIRRSRTSRLWPQRIRGRAFNGLLFCLRSALHLIKSAHRGNILLLTTEPAYLPAIGYLVHLCFGAPYVCLLYDLYPDVAVQLRVVPAKHWLVKLWDALNRQIWKRARGVIVLSSTMKDRVVRKCPDIEEKISVIHSWADPKWIVPRHKQDNWFAHQHALVDRFTVLYSGNMGRCHDIETILRAVEHLQNDPIQFVFIGAGAKRQEFRDRVRELNLKNCLFLPYQDKKHLPYSLTACDLSLVSISPGLEGIIAPSKLYGILAAGRPVAAICEPHSYLRQLLAKARCGIAIDNGDGDRLAQWIRRLTQNPALTARLGENGRQYLKANFTPEIVARQYFEILSAEAIAPTRCSRAKRQPSQLF